MKWLKMDCDAQENLDMKKLVDEWGWEWYGRYWAILGKIGMLVTERHQTFALQTNNGCPFPVKLLSDDLSTTVERLTNFLDYLSDNHLIDKKAWTQKSLIFCPKLRERADEYTQRLLTKSRHSPDQEVEVDKNKKKKKEYDVPNDVIFTAIWQKYPNRQGRKNALRHFNATVKSTEDLEKINRALENYLRSGNVANGFIKNGSTWFNEWQDWIDPTETMMRGNKEGKLGYFPLKLKRMKKCEYCNQEIIEDDYWTKHWIEGVCPKYKLASAETVHKAVEEIKALTQSMRVDPQKGERQR